LGFKSFPDKTVIKLTPAVTSIVGPNGCGKTNILDSIRWVLGEQKVSLLRGSKMEEIIFNGTKDVKPLGMAEVTLVIQNNRGVLPTEYSEVQITRRLFRSGESEYLLNKVPCRLKDITDLLMDTGLGAHVYSVIQQDMVDAILSDRTDDRRFLFEEAAGISKYKNRKKAALRKMEATESDLLRLKDIVAEVNTQVNSLSRQMNKARRYQAFNDELKGWELFLGKKTIESLSREKRELTTRRDTGVDNRIKLETDIDKLSAIQTEERQKLTDIDRQLSEISNRVYEKSEAAHALEKDITVLRQQRENAVHTIEKNTTEIESLSRRRELLLKEVQDTDTELENLREKIKNLDDELKNAEQQMDQKDKSVLSDRRERDELQKSLSDLESRLSAGRSDDSNLKEQETEINTGLSQLEQHLENLHQQKNSRLEEQNSNEQEIADLNKKLEETEARSQTCRDEIISLNDHLAEIDNKIHDQTAALEAAEARRDLLKEMIAHYEGYGSGVIAVMEKPDRWPGLIGTVAESITPKTGYRNAVEAALAETAGFMICRDRTTADNVITYLKNEKKGKAGFIILDQCRPAGEITRPDLPPAEIVGWADELIETADDLHPIAGLLLSRVVVVEPDKALSILDKIPPFFCVVTTDGQLFEGRSMVSGGSAEELSLLGRKEKITEHEAAISTLLSEIQNLKESRSKITADIAEKQAALMNINAEIENIADSTEELSRKATDIKYKLQSLESDINRSENDRKNLRNKMEQLRNRQYSLNLDHDQLSREKLKLTEALDQIHEKTGEHESELEDAENHFSRLQINQVELRSQEQQLESRIKHVRELLAEIESNSKKKSDEISDANTEITNIDNKTVQLENELKQAFDLRAGMTEKQTEIRDIHSTIQESLNQKETEIKTLRQAREETNTQLHDIELKIAEVESQIRSVMQKAGEKYEVELQNISVEIPDPELPETEWHNRMQELKERLRDFGAVNLLALEEYQTYKERQEFLNAQMKDLLEAKSTLSSTINKINQTARKLFLETIDKVRENFKKVFEELFTGGEADLRLLDEDDPLESPIEIIARPRGKRLLSIAQMSGGERALTAISLLFAIYLVKPSPFCILDEIDAPLDDANIHRFLKLVKGFSNQTQYIIITHNKITMEAAEILYGITMEQPGISKVVSVHFNEDDNGDIIDSILAGDHTEQPEPTTSDST